MTSAFITGFGSVLSCGLDVPEIAASFASGRHRWESMEPGPGRVRRRPAEAVGRVCDEAIRAWLSPIKARRMGRPSRLAVAAASMALTDAGLDEAELDGTAVVLATSFGPAIYTEKLLHQIFEEEPTAASPALFTESVANAPAAQIALQRRARGPNITITQREAGPWLALHQARKLLATGRADRVIVGAVDEVSPVLHDALDRFGVLAKGDDPIPRPYDARRKGFVLAEGATVLVLEAGSHETSYGQVVGGGGAFDPRCSATGFPPDGELLSRELRASLASWAGRGVDGVVGGASGSVEGDRAEAAWIRQTFDSVPTVIAPAGIAGHCGAALLAGATVLLGGGKVCCPEATQMDPELGLLPYTGGDWTIPQRILGLAVAPGGSAGWVGLERSSGGRSLPEAS
ncbi:MAG: beta-ketoacyl synthase N-terminal-like domain-containing protein [Acidobacteriota bacterium]